MSRHCVFSPLRYIRPRVSLSLIAALLCLAATQVSAQNRGARPKGYENFPDLVGALKATPGCLGVEAAGTRSGKQVIFAWFRDKAAVVRWYHSDVHRQVQSRFFPDREKHEPLALIKDNSGPILAIASLTFADSATAAKHGIPVSQIAIELYQPLPGGIALGGRFAPDSVRVEGMVDYTAEVFGAR